MTRTRGLAAAERLSRKDSAVSEETVIDNEDKSAQAAADLKVTSAEEDARDDKLSGPSDLRSLIEEAKQKAITSKKPKKAARIEELYQQSLSDERLSSLLEIALRTNATPEELRELQEYVNGTKATGRIVSQDATPKDNSSTESAIPSSNTAPSNPESDSGNSMKNTKIADLNPQELLTPFITSQVWPRYCRLPPGVGTSLQLEALTATQVDDRGQSRPCQPAPENWLQEVLLQLSYLLRVARGNRKALIEKVMASPGHISQEPHVLLAEEVVWVANDGPCKGRQKQHKIGLLLECVGIERKGTFWKG